MLRTTRGGLGHLVIVAAVLAAAISLSASEPPGTDLAGADPASALSEPPEDAGSSPQPEPSPTRTDGAPPKQPAPSSDEGADRFEADGDAEYTTHSRRTKNVDGSYTLEITPDRAFFEDPTHGWTEVDLTLVEDEGGDETDKKFKPKKLHKQHKVSKKAKGELLTLDTDAGPVGVSHPDATDATGTVEEKTKAKFTDGLTKGRDVVVRATVDGFEEEVVVPDGTAGSTYTVSLAVPKDVEAVQEGSTVELRQIDGTVVAVLGGGIAFDSTETVAGTGVETAVTARLVESKNKSIAVEFGVDQAWFDDPARVFPVTIDPTYSTYETNFDACAPYGGTVASPYQSCDTYVNSDNPYARPGFSAQTELRSGSPGFCEPGYPYTGPCPGHENITRTYLQFPTDSYGTGQYKYRVTAATVEVYNWGGSTSYGYTELYGSAGYPDRYTNFSNQPGVDGYGRVDRRYYRGGSGWESFNIQALAQRWFNGTHPNYGLVLQAASERSPSLFRRYRSGEYGATYSPRMTITYVGTPDPPGNAQAQAGDGQITATWSAPSTDGGQPIDFYDAYLYRNGTYTGTYARVCNTCYTATFGGLTNGDGPFRVDIYAHNSEGYSAPASTASVTPRWIPTAPSNVTATPGDTTATVSWSASNPNGASIDTYAAYAFHASGPNAGSYSGKYASCGNACRSTTVADLTNGQDYYFEVYAHNEAGWSTPGKSNTVTPGTTTTTTASTSTTTGSTTSTSTSSTTSSTSTSTSTTTSSSTSTSTTTSSSTTTTSTTSTTIPNENRLGFPLRTTKSTIQSNEPPWCYESRDNCHHDYNAADIFAPTGTPVISPVSGTVVSATEEAEGVGSRVQIRDDDGYLYYIAHMDHDPGLTVAEGDRVEVGTQLGYVGERVHAVGTDPHAHIDRLPPTYESRPACSGEGCQQYPFENVQPEFVDAYQEIPDQ